MPLFKHNRETARSDAPTGLSGLGDLAALGLAPVTGTVFDGHLEDAVHEITVVMYEEKVWAGQRGVRIDGSAVFRDAFRATIGGRKVTVANAWTNIGPERYRGDKGLADDLKGVAVCAAELPSLLPFACVQPRRFRPTMQAGDSLTGNPAFDEQFRVAAVPGVGQQVFTPDLQQRIMAHDDWIFRAERYLLGCVSKGPFFSVEEVRQRIGEVMAIVAAIPVSVLPDHVVHSEDDLIARISQLTSVKDALTLLQQLTSAEREQLAASDTPLAAFADVHTPDEAMARFNQLDQPQKMQLMAMFMRVKDDGRGR